MGVFDRLFRRRGKTVTPEQIRDALFDAAAAGDGDALARLCVAHEELVLASFGAWTKVPEAFRTPDKLQWYAQGLIEVARTFDVHRGRPELVERLMGPAGTNPLAHWHQALVDVEQLMADHQYEDAARRLRTLLDDTERLQGTGADANRPITHGRLGECLLHLRDTDGARSATERALAGCQATGDTDGIVVYLGNLYEIDRYRGDASAAADRLDRLAQTLDHLDRPAEAARHRRQATIVRAGEPLCRVVAEVDGETMELTDLPPVKTSVRFLFQRNRLTLRLCARAVELGVAAAECGELEEALACFARAASADPFDPWPSYHTAMAQLERRRYIDAIESYRQTEDLAPGWYHCRSMRWLSEQLATGAVDHDTFQRLRELDGGPSPVDAVALATVALQRKELGALRLALGEALDRQGRSAEAEDAYRRGLAIAEEPDIRTRLLVALGNRTSDPQAKVRYLHEAIDLGGNLVAAATATVVLASLPAN